MKKSIIYARVSTAAQNTDRQVSDLQAYAQRNDFEVLQIFTEQISGAKRNDEREVLKSAIDYAQRNQCTILFNELSRLGRNVWEVQENVKVCVDSQTDVYFLKEKLHLFNDDGELNPFANIMISVLGTCANLEREAIRFRMKSGYDHYRATGGKVGRKTGYRKTIEDYKKDQPNLIKDLQAKFAGKVKGEYYSVRALAEKHGVCPSKVQAISSMLKDVKGGAAC